MEITPLIKEDYVMLQEEATVSELIGKMKEKEKRAALIFRQKKYLGLIEKKSLLHSKIDVTTTKIKNHIQHTPLLNQHADVIETAYLMYQSDLSVVPVEHDKEIIGVINARDLVMLASELPETADWKVKEFKFTKSVRVNKDDPISKAIELMQLKKVDKLPVFDGNKIYGILTYKDILRKYLNWSPKRDVSAKFNSMASAQTAEADMPNLANLPVSNFSTNENLQGLFESSSMKEAAKMMDTTGLNSLIVTNTANEFLGLLTAKNMLAKIGSLKIPENYNIQFIGLKDLGLEKFQLDNIKKICGNEAMKLQRKLKNEFKLNVHFKAYDKEGKQKKYSINIRVEYPGQSFSTSQDDWDLHTAIRKTFNNAKNTLEKKFKD